MNVSEYIYNAMWLGDLKIQKENQVTKENVKGICVLKTSRAIPIRGWS